MKKTLFLVEGKTEQIFLFNFLNQIASYQDTRVEFKIYSNAYIVSEEERGAPIENCKFLIQIVNMQGDDSVISYITDNIEKISQKDFDAVFGLRDRYTGDQRKRPPNQEKIDELLLKISTTNKIRIEVTVAKEEIEAWFLSVPEFFEGYDPKLTIENIKKITNFDFDKENIEDIEHPAAMIKKILQSVNLDYRKRAADSHKIASKLDYDKLYLEKTSVIGPLRRVANHLDFSISKDPE